MAGRHFALRGLIAAVLLSLWTVGASAEIAQRPGWVVLPSSHSFSTLAGRVEQTARGLNLGVVSRASATVGVKRLLNLDIPGNLVLGLYHPSFAARMLNASIAAGIEAPIRVYITENSGGTATLSYKMPSHVFAPYMDEGGDALKELADELDAIFDQLAKAAVQ